MQVKSLTMSQCLKSRLRRGKGRAGRNEISGGKLRGEEPAIGKLEAHKAMLQWTQVGFSGNTGRAEFRTAVAASLL